jgi:hypothetical protein
VFRIHIVFIIDLDVSRIDIVHATTREEEGRFAHHFTSSFECLGREFEISRRLTRGSGFRLHIVFTTHLDVFEIDIVHATTGDDQSRVAPHFPSSFNRKIHANVLGMNIVNGSSGGVFRMHIACILHS